MNLGECFLELAKIEEDSCNVYKEFSTICNEKLKDVCIRFSKEEEKHTDFILKIYNDLSLKDKQLTEELNYFFNEKMNYLKTKEKGTSLTSEKEFFIFALQMEKDSIEIYTKLITMFEANSDEYKIIETLLKQEKNHMVYVLNQLHELK